MASENGHLQIVKKLIKAGATVNQQNMVGTHSLSHIIINGWDNVMRTEVTVRAVLRGAHVCPNNLYIHLQLGVQVYTSLVRYTNAL